jgi:hypothetical protein
MILVLPKEFAYHSGGLLADESDVVLETQEASLRTQLGLLRTAPDDGEVKRYTRRD